MPTNGAGVYTVPAGVNPVVPGTVILDTWANPTLADVAQGITDRLDRSGRGSMLAGLKLFDGLVALPGLSWASEATSGLWRPGAGISAFSILGTEVWRTLAAQFAIVLGSAATPPYSFTGDPNTGIYSPGADQIALSTAGTQRLTVSAAGLHTIPTPAAGATLQLGSLNGTFYDNANIPASGGSQLIHIGSTGSISGRVLIGDGTGWSYRLSKRTASVTTDIAVFTDNSIPLSLTPPAGEALRLISDTGFLAGYNAANTTRSGFLQLTTTGATLQVDLNQPLNLGTNGATRIQITGAGVVTPGADNTQTLGSSALRWSTVFSPTFSDGATATGTLVTSAGATSRFGSGTGWTASEWWANNAARISVNSSGNVVVAAPASGGTLQLSQVASGQVLLLQAGSAGGLLAGSGNGNIAWVGRMGTGRLTTDAGSEIVSQHSFLDATIWEISAGSTASLKSGVVIRGGGATTLPNTVSLWTADTKRFEADAVGRIYGTALHNNASSPTGTTNQYVASGTYTPTVTAVTNINSVVAVGPTHWIRVGNVVMVGFNATISTTAAAGTTSNVGVSLPIASNLASGVTNLEGTSNQAGTAAQTTGAVFFEDGTNDRAVMQWQANTTSNVAWYGMFCYLIA